MKSAVGQVAKEARALNSAEQSRCSDNADEELQVIRRAQAGDRKAMDVLVRRHKGLVVTYARRLRGMPLEDLIGYGMIGLIEAVQRFDPTRGANLATTVVLWARRHMRRAIEVNSPVLDANRRLFWRLPRAIAHLEACGLEVTADAVARETQLPADYVERWMPILRSHNVPIDAPRGDRKPLSAQIPDPRPLAEEQVSDYHDASRVRHAIEQLPPRQREVIEARWMRDEPERFWAIGERIGIKREAARQDEGRAFERMRQLLTDEWRHAL